MITANILTRTFKIEYEKGQGTCFTIDVDNRQYIVTARHAVESFTGQGTIRIMHEEKSKDLQVKLIGHGEDDIDISVLSAEFLISPTLPLTPTADRLMFGQDVYFLGFPYNLAGDETGSWLNRNFPLPFVKKAIVSQMSKTHIFLDGHNNPGFSGGPVIFNQDLKKENLSVAGVVSGYHYQKEPVYKTKEQIGYYEYNTGIMVVYNIQHALDLIHQNPVGAIIA